MINYYLLTKPGIIFGNLLTLIMGFALGSKSGFDLGLFLATLLGLGALMASACVCNNYLDRELDKKMERTRHRALVEGAISNRNALLFAAVLLLIGLGLLIGFTNWIAVSIACLGFFVYVVLYTLWKSKTVYGTAIGSIAGAVPPVVGYCAASHQFDSAAVVLFFILVLWQMPHFFSIALLHLQDYTRAGIPVLPVSHGILRTKIHMMIYIACFIPTTLLLTWFGFTSESFLWIALITGGGWLLLSAIGFTDHNVKRFGRYMFIYSLFVIGTLCLVVPLEAYKIR
jgi:heme o synthase